MNFWDTYIKLPELASEHGGQIDKLNGWVHILMMVLLVGWMGYFLFALFRFHRTRNPKADHVGVESHASTWIELGVAAIEGILLIGFSIPLWAKAVDKKHFPDPAQSTVIRVVAEQFNWGSRYAGTDGQFGKQDVKLISGQNPLGVDPNDPAGKDDIIPPFGDIVVPVNKPVIAHITSKDVIHCFKVPNMRVTQDAIPGMSIPVHFTPKKEGKYILVCAQLCGNGHASMRGYLTVKSQADYDKWAESAPKAGAGPASFE